VIPDKLRNDKGAICCEQHGRKCIAACESVNLTRHSYMRRRMPRLIANSYNDQSSGNPMTERND